MASFKSPRELAPMSKYMREENAVANIESETSEQVDSFGRLSALEESVACLQVKLAQFQSEELTSGMSSMRSLLTALQGSMTNLHEKFEAQEIAELTHNVSKNSTRLTVLEEGLAALNSKALHFEKDEKVSSQDQVSQLQGKDAEGLCARDTSAARHSADQVSAVNLPEASSSFTELQAQMQQVTCRLQQAEQSINGLLHMEDMRKYSASVMEEESRKSFGEQMVKVHGQIEALENCLKCSRPEQLAQPGPHPRCQARTRAPILRHRSRSHPGSIARCSGSTERWLYWRGKTAADVSMSENMVKLEDVATAERSGGFADAGEELEKLVARLNGYEAAFQREAESFGQGPGLRMELAEFHARIKQLEEHVLMVPDEVPGASQQERFGLRRAEILDKVLNNTQQLAAAQGDELDVSQSSIYLSRETSTLSQQFLAAKGDDVADNRIEYFSRESTAVLDKVFNHSKRLIAALGDPDPRETHNDAIERIFSKDPGIMKQTLTIEQL